MRSQEVLLEEKNGVETLMSQYFMGKWKHYEMYAADIFLYLSLK